ncbi:MAG: nucleotidyltransferase [Alphaproteobacteria bacterium]|nr:nucleotidyltransferase [Alphaproteobacteria bacterium]
MSASQAMPITFSAPDLRAFCARHHIIKLAVFGSVARGEDTSDSDLDILVEFAPGMTPGLECYAIEEDLAEMFGRSVDLNTPGFLNPRFRDEVLREAKVLYEP